MPVQYAEIAEYDSLIGDSQGLDEARKIALLQAASMLYDRATMTAPGHWGPVENAAYTFPMRGGRILWLLDESRRTYHLRAVDADKIEIDDDLDGVVDYALDLSDAWVKGYQRNALTLGEPFSAIELVATGSDVPSEWAKNGSVTVTGDWGYADQAPPAVRARVCDIAHGLSQRGFAGGYGTEERLQNEAVPVWVVRLVDSNYSHWTPSLG